MKLLVSQIHITKALLTLVFLLSYIQYLFEISIEILLVPISVLILLGYTLIIFSPEFRLRKILSNILSPTNFFFVIALPLISTTASLYCENRDPALYGLFMTTTLITIRGILCIVKLEDILKCYFYASVLFIAIYISISLPDLINAILMNHRFYNFSFHPNLLAFILVGSIPVQLWVYKTITNHKLWILVLILFNISIIFYASSRGSIVALLTGIFGISILGYTKRCISLSHNKFRKYFWKPVVIFFLITIVATVSLINHDRLVSYVYEILEINSPYRGLNSGLSGRINRWSLTLDDLKHGSLFFGNGYRTGSDLLGFSIDNGYLTLIYEMGAFVSIFVVIKYLWVTVYFARNYLRSFNIRDDALFFSLTFIMIIFLTNNIVVRYLFGMGNPFSLLCLFFFVLSNKDISLKVGTHS